MRAISSHDIKEKFLKQVCSFVKYKGAHQGIYEELSNHIEDHIDYLREMGLSQEEAEKQAVEAMGNEKEIGLALNKEHRPFLGWVLSFTNILIVFGLFYFLWALFITGIMVLTSFGSLNHKVDSEHVLYREKLNQVHKAGIITYKLKNITVLDNHEILIEYHTYSTSLTNFFRGWSHPGLMPYDQEGNNYHGGGSGTGGLIKRHQVVVENYDLSKESIYLRGRSYYGDIVFRIPLKAVD